MDFFSSSIKSVLGTQPQGQVLNGAETVERLVERVQSSTLLHDRRDACRALKALSKKYRVEVGAHGMDALRFVLETDKQDCEIVGYALDSLCNVMSKEISEEEEYPEAGLEALLHVGEQFTEMFLKHPENVSLVLSFLEEYDFKVRWNALKLLTILLNNKPRDIQDIILLSPMGVSKLMDMLSDSREVIRNETLILLFHLVKGNANIQKIVAFENAFDRLFDVIADEGHADGGIVVEDCLLLMLNLLKNNTSNQNFFKEGSYIQRLVPLFQIPPEGPDDASWQPQRVTNLLCVLQIVRCLVSPSNPNQGTSSCQKTLATSGILEALSSILIASGVPAEALTEAICTLGEAIRGSHPNQDFFSNILVSNNPPKEAVVVLLMSMVNEKQPFILRTSVLYCFQCYLFKNEVGQAQLVQTLLPSTSEVPKLTMGQLLCSGVFSHDPLSNWLSSVALSHALIENPHQKEKLLRVLLAPNPNSPPISLITQISFLLQQSSRVQSKVGFLILLSTWLTHCQLAVKMFLEVPSNVPFLTAQAASTERDDNEEIVQGLCAFLMGICLIFNDDSPTYSKDSLRRLIDNRVGMETFLSKLCEISRHEFYSKACKLPHPKATYPHELLFDYEFCKLFKALEGMVIKAVGSQPTVNGSELDDTALLAEYKELIREQDRKLTALAQTVESLHEEKKQLTSALEQLNGQRPATILPTTTQISHSDGVNLELVNELENWKEECKMRDIRIQQLELDLREAQINQVSSQIGVTSIVDRQEDDLSKEVEELKTDQEDLLVLLADQEKKITQFKQRLRALGEKVESDDDDDDGRENITMDDTCQKMQFIVGEVSSIIKEAIEESIGGNTYQWNKINQWTSNVTEGCLNNLTNQHKGFKYIVTCIIMKKNGASLHTMSAFYWDNSTDGSCTVRWENNTMYCIVSVYGLAV